MVMTKKYEVSGEEICWHCNTADLPFECTDELEELNGFIGQTRALKAIQFGLEVNKPGYNLFVTGLTGTGKASAIKSHLQSMIDQKIAEGTRFRLSDWCYVHNFADADRPQMVSLPQGEGKQFQQGLEQLLRTLREELPKLFASDEYTTQRKEIEEAGRTGYQQRLQELERLVRADGFGLQFSPSGINLFPLKEDGSPLSSEEYMKLNDEHRSEIDAKRSGLLQQVQNTMEELQGIEKDTQEKVKELDRRVADERLSILFRDLMEKSRDLPEMYSYLTGLKEYSLDRLEMFAADTTQPQAPALTPGGPPSASAQINPVMPFQINVLVDNSETKPVPIIIETNPTWGNLFGRIERRAFMGAYFSDHMMLRPGSLHLANGGYLVINIKDVLMNPGVWEGLKRTIRDKVARLEDPAVQLGIVPPQGLRPQAIPWDAKVIVAGDETIYRLLSTYDREDFWEMFKVKAEFDHQIELTPDNVREYCAFICSTCNAEGLLHADRSGVARIVEHGARLVADQTKLSSRFGQIKDLLIESDYWARKDGSRIMTAHHVKRALDERNFRLNLIEEKLRMMMAEGTLMVDVLGDVVGQVNGLVVYDMGDFSFGRPTRITAKTFSGRRGVINIEREAQLSGPIHNKGVLILGGYLGWKFAQDKPLSLSASLSFEQSYEGVEGDSASSTELYAILSSLSDLPIKQNIAVTGSVNQKGEVQPIGGVNQKIEGFFDICSLVDPDGEHGVLVPHQNVRNLMLREDVVNAVKAGSFHIYSVKYIDEGIEILTGVPAGERQPDGSYPEGTVNHLVDQRLEQLATSLRGFYSEMMAEVAD